VAIQGLQSVQARVAEIEARLQQLRTPAWQGRGWGPGLAGAGAASSSTTFGQAYQVALGAGTGTVTGAGAAAGTLATGPIRPAEVRAPGGYGKLQPPADLAGYGNGRIPADALAPIGIGNHRLAAPAARAFQQMAADAARDGVTIGVTDSYRSYDQQVDLARRKGLYSQGGWAATPGTSNHGWGMALDVDVDDRGQRWLRDNGWRYGWVESVPREPWHWEFRPTS